MSKRALALTDYLSDNGLTGAFSINRQPRGNSLITTVTEMNGGSSECEEYLDIAYVQIRSRGLPEDMQSAIDLAYAAHAIMTDDSLWPFQLDGKWVVSVNRPGGPPAFLHHDNEKRTTYVCSYKLRVER